MFIAKTNKGHNISYDLCFIKKALAKYSFGAFLLLLQK